MPHLTGLCAIILLVIFHAFSSHCSLTITERYKSLPSSATRVQFLSLQFELLEDFRIRVVQVMKEAGNEPCSPIYSAVLNASHYVVRVLREWNEQVVSVPTFAIWHLHCF